jgi:hypothetical protein
LSEVRAEDKLLRRSASKPAAALEFFKEESR